MPASWAPCCAANNRAHKGPSRRNGSSQTGLEKQEANLLQRIGCRLHQEFSALPMFESRNVATCVCLKACANRQALPPLRCSITHPAMESKEAEPVHATFLHSPSHYRRVHATTKTAGGQFSRMLLSAHNDVKREADFVMVRGGDMALPCRLDSPLMLARGGVGPTGVAQAGVGGCKGAGG